jgi:hypothetical protein
MQSGVGFFCFERAVVPASFSKFTSSVAGFGVVTLALLAAACDKKTSVEASASPASAQPVAAAPSAAGALSGLDRCVLGNWRASGVTMKLAELSGEGGANVTLQIPASGAATIDFTPMSEVHVKGAAFAFDFHYAGTASAILTTPTRGTFHSDGANYAALKVSATMKFPGAAPMPLFKDTPVSELASMATGLSALGQKLGRAGSAAPAAPAGPARGIESAPIFSSSQYSCTEDQLILHSAEQKVEWSFKRATP